MIERNINGIILEGADQQGKTTVADLFRSAPGWNYVWFGAPGPEFDFSDEAYLSPYYREGKNLYDRSFVSEIVYSTAKRNKHRIEDPQRLLDYLSGNGFVYILLRRKKYKWQDRDEEYDRKFNNKVLKLYDQYFLTMNIEKYHLDPEDKGDKILLKKLANRDFSPVRLLQEIYSHEEWKMGVCCMMLNRTHRGQVDAIRGNFFFRYKNPKDFLKASPDDVKDQIQCLGFKNRRYDMLRKFSEDMLEGKEFKKCRGIGDYARDSYRIFVEREYDFEPKDIKLKEYLEWIS